MIRERARALGVVAAAWALASAAPLTAQEPGDARTLAIPGTDQSVEIVWVPGGVFAMGSPPDEAGRDADEGPVRSVRLPGFWMTVHEVTYDQYAPFRFRSFDDHAGAGPEGTFDADAVTRPSPPYEDPGHGMEKGRHPATGVTRMNALQYARWLSEKTGRFFRLPTEAEWEYACRAGGDGAFGGGAGDPADLAWFADNAGGAHHPVGGRGPNAWGLHDLQGNVAEWVLDGYQADAYAAVGAGTGAAPGVASGAEPIVEPRVGDPVRGQGVVRGGSFDDGAAALRCAAREPETAAWKRRDPQIPRSRWWNTDSPHVGFRLVSPGEEMDLEAIQAWFAGVLGG